MAVGPALFRSILVIGNFLGDGTRCSALSLAGTASTRGTGSEAFCAMTGTELYFLGLFMLPRSMRRPPPPPTGTKPCLRI